jgi:hypothetical protein
VQEITGRCAVHQHRPRRLPCSMAFRPGCASPVHPRSRSAGVS